MATVEKRTVGDKTRWLVRYRDPEGKQRAKTFETKGEAKDYQTDLSTDLKKGSYVSPRAGKVTLAEWGARWLDSRAGVLKRKAEESQRSIWRSQVLPALGTRQLDSLRVSDIQAWVSAMRQKGLSASRIRQSVLLLSQMLEMAVADRLIYANPANLKRGGVVRLPKDSKYRPRPLTYREVEKLVQVLPEDDGLLVDVMAYAGLRFGEAVALAVRDVDLESGVLNVLHSLSDVSGVIELEPPKNGESRVVPLPDFLAERLSDAVVGRPGDALVFQAPRGGYVRYNNWRNRRWLPAFKATGLDPADIHSLRRLYVRTLTDERVAGSVMRDVAGHSTAVMTLHYSATTETARQQVRDALTQQRREI